MDHKHAADIHKHLEKQNELLTDAYKAMSDELHRLQVEEEMLMRKYYEYMRTQAPIEKNTSKTDTTKESEKENDEVTTLGHMTTEEPDI